MPKTRAIKKRISDLRGDKYVRWTPSSALEGDAERSGLNLQLAEDRREKAADASKEAAMFGLCLLGGRHRRLDYGVNVDLALRSVVHWQILRGVNGGWRYRSRSFAILSTED